MLDTNTSAAAIAELIRGYHDQLVLEQLAATPIRRVDADGAETILDALAARPLNQPFIGDFPAINGIPTLYGGHRRLQPFMDLVELVHLVRAASTPDILALSKEVKQLQGYHNRTKPTNIIGRALCVLPSDHLPTIRVLEVIVELTDQTTLHEDDNGVVFEAALVSASYISDNQISQQPMVRFEGVKLLVRKNGTVTLVGDPRDMGTKRVRF